MCVGFFFFLFAGDLCLRFFEGQRVAGWGAFSILGTFLACFCDVQGTTHPPLYYFLQ